MFYKFRCPVCEHRIDIDIPMADYDKAKHCQLCPVCFAKDSNNVVLERIIEWSGTASGNGDGWFGRSDGSKSI